MGGDRRTGRTAEGAGDHHRFRAGTMTGRYLEITFRNGKPLAAYLSLNRRPSDRSARTSARENGLVVDYAEDGRVIGVEITSPSRFSVDGLNALLSELGVE